uniref:Uncharacterized protein n=1 Tax=Acrobeloides nanus TaxID=290746 RepID=A0A914D8I8_9BILA
MPIFAKNFNFLDSTEIERLSALKAHWEPSTKPSSDLNYKAYETQDFLRDNCPDVITVNLRWRNPIGEWPPNSPDLNPLDYAVWSILEEKACQKPHPNVESLKKALKKAWKEITLNGEDRGQLPEAPEGLHRCKRWPFWINLFVLLL